MSKLVVIMKTTPIPQRSAKDPLPPRDTKNVIYQFTCSCSRKYIGRTGRKLSGRMKEHLPSWLMKGEKRASHSSITKQIVNSECVFRRDQFRILLRTNIKLLPIAEALAVNRFKPDLDVQKNLLHKLKLPWS